MLYILYLNIRYFTIFLGTISNCLLVCTGSYYFNFIYLKIFNFLVYFLRYYDGEIKE